VQGFVHVMSGSRAALAYQAFNITNVRQIQAGDPVLVQLEAYCDGFWSEVTRTFFAGEPGAEGRRIYECCLEAQKRAIGVIRNGIAASEVDQVARDYLTRSGFGQYFRHGLGHGVGFQAISHLQPPRLSPPSTDTILTDMVFNVEPGVYVHGWGGVRINDTVVAREKNAEIITDIPRDLQWAIVSRQARA
jgi:Xaa-Pro aminopeptidase